MNGRAAILKALRASAMPEAPKPTYPQGIVFEDRIAKFAETLSGVGGICMRVATLQEADARVRELEAYRNARQVASFVSGVGESTIDCSQFHQPHDLRDLDYVILPGEFGVAENASVWAPGSALGRHRAAFVIAQHLALVINGSEIVSNMQEAYARVKLEKFGVFISGPSKTADIEQSLVIGAHGARSCTVFIVVNAKSL
jgi:L-lactate dehydrogenase complex protein LldG